jgi:hypothetical protein
MGRVYVIYLWRRMFNVATFKIFLSLFAVYELYVTVSWSHVFANMPNLSNTKMAYAFFSSALTNTEVVVQLSLAVLLVVGFNQVIRILKKENQLETAVA